MVDYGMSELAKRIRAQAALTIANESQVVQNNERKVQESMDIILLCNRVIDEYEIVRTSINSGISDAPGLR